MTYQLAPRPQIEGIACRAGAAYAGQCTYRGSPGRVIEIGPTLRLLSSSRLSGVTAANVSIRPALAEMSLRLAPHGPPQHKLIEITGDWEPDQPYEVRVSNLRTEDGQPVRALPPLAVRSSGHPPGVRVESGHLSFEHDAAPSIPFATIRPDNADVVYRAVGEGEELRALVAPGPFVRQGGVSHPLAALAPEARANRWGAGEFLFRGRDGRDASIAVVSFRADASREPGASQIAFAQSTDLGVTLRASAEGILVWVTSLSRGEPVAGASVTVADAEAHERASGRTDADGVAQIELDANPLVVTHAVRVVHGSDRAALLLDPRAALGPSSMGLTPGAEGAGDGPTVSVFTDRGAYRRSEGLHAKVVFRQVEGSRARAVRSGDFVARLLKSVLGRAGRRARHSTERVRHRERRLHHPRRRRSRRMAGRGPARGRRGRPRTAWLSRRGVPPAHLPGRPLPDPDSGALGRRAVGRGVSDLSVRRAGEPGRAPLDSIAHGERADAPPLVGVSFPPRSAASE